MYDLLIAIALLTSPPTGEDYRDLATPPLAWTIQQTAIQMELMDQRESHYIMVRMEDFNSDVHLLQKRNEDLKDAPKLADGHRFIDRETINDLLSFNRAYKQHLENEALIRIREGEWYRETIAETEQLYHLWDLVRDGKCEYYYVTVRRMALKNLKSKLGEPNFFIGQMPPVVPIWRFTSID